MNASPAAETNAHVYVPVASKIQPPAAAPRAAPTWWANRIHPDSTPTDAAPKMRAVSAVVAGTVEIQLSPKITANA